MIKETIITNDEYSLSYHYDRVHKMYHIDLCSDKVGHGISTAMYASPVPFLHLLASFKLVYRNIEWSKDRNENRDKLKKIFEKLTNQFLDFSID